MHINPLFGMLGLSGGELVLILMAMIIFAVIVGTVIVLVFGLLSERKRPAAAPQPPAPPIIPQATKRVCPQCATELAADAPQGLCPKCLLKAAFESQAAPAGQGPREPSPALPVDEIRKAFPLLEIIELLGQGGMGMVYKARQAQLDRLVALKILSPALSSDPAFAERFLREAKALAHLNHPNIVSVYDFGKAGEFYFLTMEFVDGMNLWQLEQSKKRLTPEEALSIIPKICDALQYAHDEGIVHRDIKPANILVDKKGRVKIADFGLAKLLGTEPKGLGLTQTKMTMGTPQYMAPEQLEKPLEVDHRADIFSLGVVFYEMLTGELPLGRFAPPSRKVQMDVRLDEVVMRALEKEPELRYQQASQVKTDVETITNDPQRTVPLAAPAPPAAKVGTPAPPKMCPNVVIGAVWAAFFFIAATVIWTFRYHPYGAPRFFYSLISIPLFLLGATAPFGTTIIGWMAIGNIRRAKGQLTGLGVAIFDALLFPWLIVTGAMAFLWYVVLMMLKISPLMPNWLNREEGIMCIWIIGLFGLAVMMVAILVWIIRGILRANKNAKEGALPRSTAAEAVKPWWNKFTKKPKTPGEMRHSKWPWILAVMAMLLVVFVLVVRTFVVAPFRVEGSSVSPEIPAGSHVLVFKLARLFQPGEIVAYNYNGRVFLGRVAKGSSVGSIQIKFHGVDTQIIPRSEIIGRVVFNTRARSDFNSAQSQDGPAVTFLAVQANADGEPQLWKPDGSPLPEPMHKIIAERCFTRKAAAPGVLFTHFILVSNAPDESWLNSWVVRTDSTMAKGDAGTGTMEKSEALGGMLFHFSTWQTEEQRTTRLRFGFAIHPPRTLLVWEDNPLRLTQNDWPVLTEVEDIAIKPFTSKRYLTEDSFGRWTSRTNAGSEIKIILPGENAMNGDAKWFLEITDQQGGLHTVYYYQLTGLPEGGGIWNGGTAWNVELAPEDIRSIKLRGYFYADYFWTDFPEVRLEPNFKPIPKEAIELIDSMRAIKNKFLIKELSFKPGITNVATEADAEMAMDYVEKEKKLLHLLKGTAAEKPMEEMLQSVQIMSKASNAVDKAKIKSLEDQLETKYDAVEKLIHAENGTMERTHK